MSHFVSGVGNKVSHIVGGAIKNPLATIGDVASIATGNPWFAVAGNAGNTAAKGGNLGQIALSGAGAYGGAQLGNALTGTGTLGLGNTVLGRSVGDLYSGSLLQSGYNGINGGLSDLYSGSLLQSGVNGIGDGASDLYNGSLLQSGVNGIGDGASDLYNGSGLSDILGGSSGDAGQSVLGDSANTFRTGGSLSGEGLSNPFSTAGSASPYSGGSAFGGGASSFGTAAPASSSFSSYALPALGAVNSLYANSQAQDQLKKAGEQAQGYLNPYLSSGTAANSKLSDFLGTSGTPTSTADILASNPAYQFQLQQGTDAMNRKQAASGNYFSGAALQGAQDYGQGLANQTAQEYYSRLAQQSGQGLSTADQSAGIAGQLGSAGANATISSGNTLSQLLAGTGRTWDPLTRTYK